MASPITAASYVGPVPVTSITIVDDGDKLRADDLRVPIAALLANAVGAGFPVRYEYKQVVTSSPWAISSPNSVTGNTWTSTSITLDIPDCKANDVIEVRAKGNWQLNSSSSAGNVAGRAKLLFTENVDGSPSVISTVYDQATITDDSGSLALPHNEPWELVAKHTVVTAGKTRIVVQGRSQDLSGGAGTGTIVFTFVGRMDVTHLKKS